MKQIKKLKIAVVGLGFGAEFVPIYLSHPNVDSVVICDGNKERLSKVRDNFGINRSTNKFEDIINSKEIDAVHLVSGIPEHAKQTLAVLNSGKHCACTVPMATTIEDLRKIVSVQKKVKINYMMMETTVYTRQFFYAQELKEKGKFGRIQFMRGAHYQDMESWPKYWAGLPPMWYMTHAISPLLAITKSRAVKVHCFGSGKMRKELYRQYKNPFPVETAIFKLDKEEISIEVTRTLFQCARPYMETFVIYGENACYEWQMENEPPVLFTGLPLKPGKWRQFSETRPEPKDRAELLPPEIAKFTKSFVYSNKNAHLSFKQGGGHHGSHPHMVNEFISSIIEKRSPYINAVTAANWTAPGICAHQSAMQGGKEITIPIFK